MSRTDRSHHRSLLLGLVAGGMAGGFVVAALASEGAGGSPMVTDVSAQPLVIDVTPKTIRPSATVTYLLETVAGRDIASNRSGLITWVGAHEGRRLTNGTVLAEVDDRPIVAMVSARPPYRSLREGDYGPDVRALETFLVGMDLLVAEPDTYFGYETASAVGQFNRQYRQQSTSGVFDVGSVAWLGPKPLRAVTVTRRTGQQIQAGQALVTGPPQPVSVTVTEPEHGLSAQPGGYRMIVGETHVRYVAGSGEITDPRSVAKLARVTRTANEGVAEVVAVRGEPVLQVPASAVVADSDGTLCVFESVNGPPVTVSPLRGQLSVVDLPAQAGLREVLVNPAQTRSSAECS